MIVERLTASSLTFVLVAVCTAPAATAQQPPQEEEQRRQEKEKEEQEQITEMPPMIVTARKRGELAHDVPQSLTAFSATQIRDGGFDSVKDASYFVPNTLITEFSSRRLSFPFVRGIGSGRGEPAVATFIDGVPQLSVSSTNLPLLDVERIEFLRGPRGALYGRNTLGGAIHVISARPSTTTEVDAGLTVGNFDRQDYRLSFSTPLVDDQLFLSAAVLRSTRDGYTENDRTGNDVDYRDDWFGRSQLLWLPDDDDEVRLVVYGDRARDGGFVLSDLEGLRARPNRIDQDFEGWTDRDIFASSLTWNHFGDSANLTSITAVQDWAIEGASDFDFSALDGVRRYTTEDQTYISQELRLASPEGVGGELTDDASLAWLVGVSGFYSESTESAANEFRPGGAGILFPPQRVGTDRATGDFESYAIGVFGQLSLEVFERWELTGAIRYDFESKDADIRRVFESGGVVVPVSATSERLDFDEVLPRASVAYRWSDRVTAYGLAARGFKAGGFNLTAPTGQTTFGPETSWSYEVGAKTNWLENHLEANVALFHIDWEDMQLSQFDANTGGFVTNAGESRSRGVELELVARPIDQLKVFGGLGYLDTEFGSFTDQFGMDVGGRSLPFAPDTTASLGVQYTADVADDGTVFVRAEYFHVGEFFYDAGNRASERYSLVNFRLGGGGDSWRLEGWVRNVLDERYVSVAFQSNPGDPSQFVGESAAPRTFGMSLRVTF